jgi:hypothetical protein
MAGRRSWSGVATPVPVERRTDAKGRVFDSQGEMLWYLELEILQSAGGIRNLARKVWFPLVLDDGRPLLIRSQGYPNGRVGRYTPDAVFDQPVTPDLWERVYAEYKGFDEPKAQLRRAVFELIYGVRVTLFGPAVKAAKRKAKKREVARAARKVQKQAAKLAAAE